MVPTNTEVFLRSLLLCRKKADFSQGYGNPFYVKNKKQ